MKFAVERIYEMGSITDIPYMNPQSKLFIAFPCYNPVPDQWTNLEKFCADLKKTFPGIIDFIVVDDGSPRWIDPPVSFTKDIKILRLPQNLGKGGALRSAIGAMPSDSTVFAFLDFDLPYTAEELLGVCAAVTNGSDVCVGDRTNLELQVNSSNLLSRQFAHSLFRLFMRTIVIGGIPDTQCGVKAYCAEAARRIAEKAVLNGFLFDVEWLYIACHHKLAIRSWPVKLLSQHKSSSLGSFLNKKLLKDFLRLIQRILAKQYSHPLLSKFIQKRRENLLSNLLKIENK